MPIPRLLNLEQDEDGCALFCCLQCKERWRFSYSRLPRFCPFCGIQFEGRQPNAKVERLDRIYEFCRQRGFPRDNPPFIWVIETRTKYRGKFDKWEVERRIDGRTPPKIVLGWMRDIKKDNDWMEDTVFEARIRVEPFSETTYGRGAVWGRLGYDHPLYIS